MGFWLFVSNLPDKDQQPRGIGRVYLGRWKAVSLSQTWVGEGRWGKKDGGRTVDS